jgi:hypothetical protein
VAGVGIIDIKNKLMELINHDIEMAGDFNDDKNCHPDTRFENDETWTPNHSIQIIQINSRHSMI